MRVSRVTLSVFLVALLMTGFLFRYLFVILTPISEQIIETQRDLLFRNVFSSSQRILLHEDGLRMLKSYLNKLQNFSTDEVINVEIEDENHNSVWSVRQGKSEYYKIAKLHLPGGSSSSKGYFLRMYFVPDSIVFSVPFLVLSVVLFFGFFVIYELMLSLINSGLCLSRWCYRRNLNFWAQGDFSQLAFVPSRYSDQSTQQQMFLVQSINEIFSFLQRRCHVLQNSTGSSEIVDACHQLIQDAQSHDKLTSRYITMLTAWAPMTELRWMTILVACQLSVMVELSRISLPLILFSVVFSLLLGIIFANTVTYRYSRRFVGFLAMGCLWTGVMLFWKYRLVGTSVAAFAVGLFCHSLSLLPDSRNELIRYIIPSHESLRWPIRHLISGFFVPIPLFYVLLERVSGDVLSSFPAVLSFVTSYFLWRYIHRNPVWRYSLVPVKSLSNFWLSFPPIIVLFFCFVGGGLCWVAFYQTSHFLAAWFIALACGLKLFSLVNNNFTIRRLMFLSLGIFLFLIPLLSGVWVRFLSRDALIFVLSLIEGIFIDISDNNDNLVKHVYSPLSIAALFLGGGFFYLMDNWGSLNLTFSIISIFGGIAVYYYGERLYDH
ncbi:MULTISPECIES: hypothetical protein [Candidatus Ichthyocystis]|uniref:Putative membrane protein n=1 Tax=Candidatus Ichthyocystis hellenicum TaxID=1561003 RepID=A0A0S4M460_9BURK|nr:MULTISPECIES: hypothetical protein [Ichthyocystis]CUT17094.1 putative membrane protein [Candidatus Ichthyocystis hellenicum]